MAQQFSEFLDLIETIDARDLASPNAVASAITRDDPAFGVRISAYRQQHRRTAAYRRGVAEAMRLIDRVRAGSLPSFWLKEAMSTSDFGTLFGDITDRVLLGGYAEVPQTWRNYMRRGTVADFRNVNRFIIEGGEAILDEVKEAGEYKAAKLVPGKYTLGVKKYGRRMPFTWEAMVNDDLDALTDVPTRFGRAARRSEERFATTLYAGTTGPLASIYSAGNKNQIIVANGAASNNPILSVAGLQDGLRVMANQVDSDGEPIAIDAVELVIPPALEFIAAQILNATEFTLTNEAGRETRTANFLRGRFRVNVNAYLPKISTTNGNTSWYLFASSGQNRPAIEFDFLRGYEEPQLFQKSPNAVRVGSGALVDPMQGSFEDDTLDYKVRHIFGGGPIDPKATVASNGTGV